jgi:nitrite reductase (NADH) small subunit
LLRGATACGSARGPGTVIRVDHFQPVLALSELPVGSSRKVTVNYQDIVLYRFEDGVFALSAACPHARGPLDRGTVSNGVVTCPWHNWMFDVRTGVSAGGARALTFPVRIEADRIHVDAGAPLAHPPPPPIELPEDM